LGTLRHFRIPSVICINKSDIYPQGTEAIREFADKENIELVGEIPYDENLPKSMVMGKPITLMFPNSPASLAIRKLWETIVGLLDLPEEL
jgi:MinD superfamily P-loop ATPase